MKSKLLRARSFSASDWLLLARAWAWLLLIDLGLRVLPFKNLQKRLALGRAVPAPPSGSEAAMIVRAARMVDRARRLHLYPMTCLRRSLALQRLLAGQGIDTALRFGVRPGIAASGQFQAHAWLEHDGRPISEPEVLAGRFRTLAAKFPGNDN